MIYRASNAMCDDARSPCMNADSCASLDTSITWWKGLMFLAGIGPFISGLVLTIKILFLIRKQVSDGAGSSLFRMHDS
jgi:hypothetical protein